MNCPHCFNLMNEDDKFCSKCGKKPAVINHGNEKRSINLILYFYLSYLGYAVISFFLYEENSSFLTNLIIEISFILLTLIFSFTDREKIYRLYNIADINWKGILFSILFPVCSALLVYYCVNWLNLLLFEEEFNSFYEYINYENSFFWAFIFIVIVAPVFEELAFRGFLFNQLRNVSNPTVTILATAILFALIHFSYLSFIWIFPFGIILGYLRHKYNSLWLSMLVHFIHNLIVLLLDYHNYTNSIFFETL